MLSPETEGRVSRDLVLDPSSYRAPQEGLEATLARWWADVLRLDRVGSDDDFFALGGDSLAAEALFAAIRSEFALDLPTALLLDAPTVATLAPAIQRGRVAGLPPGPAESPQVLRAPSGPGDPLVIVPPRRQKELAYRRLARRLAYAGPILMLHHQPLATMAGVAAEHLRAIKAQGYGPRLHFFGECWGGLLTLELARQAAAYGLEPGMVAVFDPPPLLRRTDRLRARFGHFPPVALAGLVADRVRGYRRRFESASWSERATLLARKGRSVAARLTRKAANAELREEIDRTLVAGRERSRNSRDPLSRAGLTYAPRPPGVPIDLFVTRDRPAGDFRESRDEWARLLRAADRTHPVPGRHTGDTVWGHTDALAAALDALLAANRGD